MHKLRRLDNVEPLSLDRAFDRFDRLFRDIPFFNGTYTTQVEKSTSETVTNDGKGNYVITLDVPGIKKEDLDISLLDDVLTIEGKTGNRSVKYTYTGFRGYEVDSIAANLDLGVLVITVPIKQAKKNEAKKIPLNVG